VIKSSKVNVFFIAMFLISSLVLWFGNCQAKESTNPFGSILAEGRYRTDELSQDEDDMVAEERSLIRAKRNAVEQVGTVIRSDTRVENYMVVTDVVDISAAAAMKVTILEHRKIPIASQVYEHQTKINAQIEEGDLSWMSRGVQEKSLQSDYKNLQVEYDNNMKLDESLRQQWRSSANEDERQALKGKIIENNKQFQVIMLFDEGYVQFLNKKYGEVVATMSKVIELAPDYADAYNYRGNGYAGLRRYDEALVEINKAIQLKPDYETAYYNRGGVYAQKGDWKAAVNDYSKALTLDPQDYSAYNNRGNVYLQQEKLPEAMADFNKTLLINSKYVGGYINRGLGYFNKEQYQLAIADFNRALALDAHTAKAYYNKALAHEQLDEKKEAMVAYQEFIKNAAPEQVEYVKIAEKRIAELKQ